MTRTHEHGRDDDDAPSSLKAQDSGLPPPMKPSKMTEKSPSGTISVTGLAASPARSRLRVEIRRFPLTAGLQ